MSDVTLPAILDSLGNITPYGSTTISVAGVSGFSLAGLSFVLTTGSGFRKALVTDPNNAAGKLLQLSAANINTLPAAGTPFLLEEISDPANPVVYHRGMIKPLPASTANGTGTPTGSITVSQPGATAIVLSSTGGGSAGPSSSLLLSSLSPPPVGTDAGAILSTLFHNAAAANKTAIIDQAITIAGTRSISGLASLSVRSSQNGWINMADDNSALSLEGFVNCDVELNVRGCLSSRTQFQTLYSTLTPYFGSGITFEAVDNAGNVTTSAGSDFTHSLSGDIFTVGLGVTGNNDLIRRRVISAPIPLGSTSRYVVDAIAGAVAGDGNAPLVFRLYDAGNNLLGTYNPGDDSGANYQGSIWHHMITGADHMRVVLETNRTYQTATGLVGSYDLGKITVYKVINDLAAQNLSSGPADIPHVYLQSNSSGTRLGGRYEMMRRTAIIVQGGASDCEVSRARFTAVYQGVGVQHATDIRALDNQIDLRLGLQGGALMNNLALRTRGVSGGAVAYRAFVARNRIVGASWGIEMLTGRVSGCGFDIEDNHIEAAYCGISTDGNNGGGVRRNTVLLSDMGNLGIELTGSSDGTEAVGNNIKMGHNAFGVGYGASNSVKVVITGGTVEAPLAASFTPTTGVSNTEFRFQPGHVVWSAGICLTQAGDSHIEVPSSRRVRVFHIDAANYAFAVTLQPISAPYRAIFKRSDIEPAGGGAIRLQGPQVFDVSDVLVRSDGNARSREMEIDVPTTAPVDIRLNRIQIVGSNALQDKIVVGTPVDGSLFTLGGNGWNHTMTNRLFGLASKFVLLGDGGLRGGATWSPGAIPAGATASTTFSVPGLNFGNAQGYVLSASPQLPAGLPNGIVVGCYPSADDTVTVTLTNITGASITPAACAWKIAATM